MTDDANLRALQAAALTEARAAIDRLAALFHEPADAVVAAAAAPRWIAMKEAAALRGCTVETMTRHVRERGLGSKVDGRWQIDRARVLTWLAGQHDDGRARSDSEFDVLRGHGGSNSRFLDNRPDDDQ